MQAAQVHLIGVEIRRAEPHAGESAFGDRLEVSARRIDLDDLLLDEFLLQVGLPEVAHRLVAGQKQRVVEFSAEQGRGGFRSLEDGAAARALGQQDLGDVVKRIDAGHLMDFLADEVHGLGVGHQRDAHAVGGRGLFVARRSRAAVLELAALAERPALAIAIPPAFAAAAVVRPALVTAERALSGGELLSNNFLLLAGIGARP